MLTRAAPVASAARSDVVVADAAGQLHLDVQPLDHVGEQVAVGPAPERGVEVDQVDPLGAVALPGQRGLQRIAVGRLACRPRPAPGGRPGRRRRRRRAAGSGSRQILRSKVSTDEGGRDEHDEHGERDPQRPGSPRVARRIPATPRHAGDDRGALTWHGGRTACRYGRAPDRAARGRRDRRAAPPLARRGARAAWAARGPAAPRRGRSGPACRARLTARARSLLTDAPAPSCAAAPRRRRRTSPGGTGWPPARRSRPRRRTARRGRSSRPRRRVQAGRRPGRVRVDEVEARVRRQPRRTSARPARPSTVFQPMCGTTGASSRVTSPGQQAQPLGHHAVLVAGLEQHLHADADAEHRRGRPRPGRRSPARRRARRCRPCTPRTRRRPAPPGRRPGGRGRSAVTVTSAPTRASARSADRRLPDP